MFITLGVLYLDCKFYFVNLTLCVILSMRNLIVEYTPSSENKSMREIKKAIGILQRSFKRIKLRNKEWNKAFIKLIFSVNEELVGFMPVDIMLKFHLYSLIRVENAPLGVNNICILYSFLSMLNNKVHLNKIMDNLSTKKRVRKEIFEKLVGSNECGKKQYNQGVNSKSFQYIYLIMLYDIKPHLDQMVSL